VDVGGLQWKEVVVETGDPGAAKAKLARDLGELEATAATTVVRTVLRGPVEHPWRHEVVGWLADRAQAFAGWDLRDESVLSFSAAELTALRQAHPLLAQVMADLAQARLYATGAVQPGVAGEETLGPAEYRGLVEELKLDAGMLDEAFFDKATELLTAKLQEEEP
jgi:hypothetical protein